MKIEEIDPKILYLFDHYGLKYDDEPGPTYDGKKFHFGQFSSDEEWNVIHELAHWIVASPTQRTYANFGLGTDPSASLVLTPDVIGPRKGERIEQFVFEVQNSIMRLIQYRHFESVDIIDKKNFERLHKLGVLKEGYPVGLVAAVNNYGQFARERRDQIIKSAISDEVQSS